MTDHLFPESTTYVHSYPAHEAFPFREVCRSPENRSFVYEEPSLLKRTGRDSDILKSSGAPPIHTETLECCAGQPKPKKSITSSLGQVELSKLTTADRNFFLAQTYKTTSSDYDKIESPPSEGSLAKKKPFTNQDDRMLKILNASKPNLAYYGFGLPNKCCEAWNNVQSRTLPKDSRTHVGGKMSVENPFAGYPEKMYPYILSKELCPQYDGSFVFGYTGHQRRCLDYPEDVTAILRHDFPKIVPRALTTNQANLIHLPIPMCEKQPPSTEAVEAHQ